MRDFENSQLCGRCHTARANGPKLKARMRARPLRSTVEYMTVASTIKLQQFLANQTAARDGGRLLARQLGQGRFTSQALRTKN